MNFQNLGLFASVTDGQARTDSGTPYAVRAPGAAFRSTFRPILSSIQISHQAWYMTCITLLIVLL